MHIYLFLGNDMCCICTTHFIKFKKCRKGEKMNYQPNSKSWQTAYVQKWTKEQHVKRRSLQRVNGKVYVKKDKITQVLSKFNKPKG